MLSIVDYIRLSLEVNLFFARIMKEHSLFLEAGFTAKNSNLIQQAEEFKNQFSAVLSEATALSDGLISPEVAMSGELVTPYTLNAEMGTQYYTDIAIDTNITRREAAITGNIAMMPVPMLEQRVFMLNQRALELVNCIIAFKARVLNDVLACKIFTANYPLLIDHILREAKFYCMMLQRLQNRQEIDTLQDALSQEAFWNRIMAEHAKFIRGLLDPTEVDLITTANNYANEFDALTMEAKEAIDKTTPVQKVTEDSLKAAKGIRDFKASGTKGLIECKIKSIMVPLLGDHVLREANHFIRLLKMFEKRDM